MSARRSFTVGAVAGVILWPLLALAIGVAVSIGNAKRREAREAYEAATEAQRRDWAEFERTHPELAGEGS